MKTTPALFPLRSMVACLFAASWTFGPLAAAEDRLPVPDTDPCKGPVATLSTAYMQAITAYRGKHYEFRPRWLAFGLKPDGSTDPNRIVAQVGAVYRANGITYFGNPEAVFELEVAKDDPLHPIGKPCHIHSVKYVLGDD